MLNLLDYRSIAYIIIVYELFHHLWRLGLRYREITQVR